MSIISSLAALAFTLGLLFLTLYIIKKVGKGVVRLNGSVPMDVMGRIPLDQKQGIASVRVGERVLVVSFGEGGVRLLHEVPLEEGKVFIESHEARVSNSDKFEAIFKDAVVRAKGWVKPTTKIGLILGMTLFGGSASLAQEATISTARSVAQAAQSAAQEQQTPPARSTAVPAPSGPTPQFQAKVGSGTNNLQISGAVGIVMLMGLLTVLPTLVLLMTSFTRILIVLNLLRQAIGTQNTPPTQLLTALALLLTAFIMNPVLEEANTVALQPFLRNEITQTEAFERAVVPFRGFMLKHTHEDHLALFIEMSGQDKDATDISQVSTIVVTSAFVTSELKSAFLMGFYIFLPFLIIDIITSSVLMSLGFFMLPPLMISLPFKLLLFVLADGWFLIVQRLVEVYK